MARQKSNDPVPLDNQVCYAIYSAGMAIQRLYKPWLDQLGLTYPQRWGWKTCGQVCRRWLSTASGQCIGRHR
jgi:hypothetical protein